MTKLTYEFNHRSDTVDGLRYECKQCNVENVQQWRELNRDQANASARNYYASSV